MGDPPANGQMGKSGEEGRRGVKTHHFQHMCNCWEFSQLKVLMRCEPLVWI